MGEDDSDKVSTGSGGWSVYKRLVMRMMETCVSDVRELLDRVTRIESDLKQLREWVRDNDGKSDKVRDRVSKAESDLLAVRGDLQAVVARLEENADATNRVVRDRTPSPGFIIEAWRHPLGKVLASILAIAALLGAGAAYNAVSIAQVDIRNHLPRSGEDRSESP